MSFYTYISGTENSGYELLFIIGVKAIYLSYKISKKIQILCTICTVQYATVLYKILLYTYISVTENSGYKLFIILTL